MITLTILAIYCLIGFMYGHTTKQLFKRQERKHWISLSLIIWPVLMTYQFFKAL